MNRREFLRDATATAAVLAGTRLTAQPAAIQQRFVPTHFASPTGAGSHNGSRGNEWTLAEAYEQASAGHRVQFAPGTYVTRSGPVRTQALTPRQSGTSENPIVFFAQHPAVYHLKEPQLHTTWVSDLKVNGTTGSVTGHAERVPGGHFVVWDGISMRQINGAWNNGELGVVSLFAGGQLDVKFLRCLFDQQGQGQTEAAFNWGAVFIQATSGIEFGDCIFQNIPGSRNDENAMPIVTYAAGQLEVHHCEFRDNNGGSLWLKGVPPGSDHDNRPVRLHHCLHTGFTSLALGFGAVGQGNARPGEFCDVFQNVWRAAPSGLGIAIHWYDVSNGRAPRNVRLVNNTFIGAIPFEGGEEAFHRLKTISEADDIWRDSMFRNNIVQHMSSDVRFVSTQYGAATSGAFRKMQFDHNCYSSGFRDYGGLGMAAWRKLGQDMNSLVGNPRLRNVSQGDARLEPNSPVRAGGSNPGIDVLNLLGKGPTARINVGAYVTDDMSDVIGVRPAATTASLPLVWKWPYSS